MFISKELNMLELRFFFLMEVFYVWSLNIQLGIREQRVMLHAEKSVCVYMCVCLYIQTFHNRIVWYFKIDVLNPIFVLWNCNIHI